MLMKVEVQPAIQEPQGHVNPVLCRAVTAHICLMNVALAAPGERDCPELQLRTGVGATRCDPACRPAVHHRKHSAGTYPSTEEP